MVVQHRSLRAMSQFSLSTAVGRSLPAFFPLPSKMVGAGSHSLPRQVRSTWNCPEFLFAALRLYNSFSLSLTSCLWISRRLSLAPPLSLSLSISLSLSLISLSLCRSCSVPFSVSFTLSGPDVANKAPILEGSAPPLFHANCSASCLCLSGRAS